MEPHQQRIIDEQTELNKKARFLSNFISLSSIFPTLHPTDQELLREQNEVMWQYPEILEKRIARFG